MERIRCPQCGGGIITREMWGWVNPATGQVRVALRRVPLRHPVPVAGDVRPGILYAAFYVVAVPVYLVWRLFTHRKYTVRRTEYICEECDHHWTVDRAK